MKKRLSIAKSPLAKIQSDQEAAEYFESHSVAGVWDQLAEAPQAKPSPALARKIRDRHAGPRSADISDCRPLRHRIEAACAGYRGHAEGDLRHAGRALHLQIVLRQGQSQLGRVFPWQI